jgi:PAS domain S-box-containing protein
MKGTAMKKRNDAAVDASYLQAIIEASHNAILAVDSKGVIRVVNGAAARTLGMLNQRLLGKHLSEIDPEAWEDFRAILKTGASQINIKKRKTGNRNVIAHRTPVLSTNRIVGVVSVFQDVSELEKLSVELSTYKQLASELDTIIESSYDGISLSDGAGKLLRVNSSWEKITGLRAKEVIGRSMADLEKEGYISEAIPLLVLKHRGVVTKPSRVLSSGRDVLVTGTPIFDENGKISLVVTNVRDMTDLNRLNEQLEKSKKLAKEYYSKLTRLRKEMGNSGEIVAVSKPMRDVLDLALRVAQVDAPVLIQGETGAGKEVVARLIHAKSHRANRGPFVKIDCGAIPENLLESELFGYEKGAFTGARDQGKKGRFELAEGGTLFLDEIEALSLNLQVKLLSAVQDLEIVPIGGSNPKKINTRIIAASNRDLRLMVRDSAFREDLFFRLNVVPIYIAPLRERKEDILPLVNAYLRRYNVKYERNKRLSRPVIDCLQEYQWTGNVRELANLIEQLVVVTYEDEIIPNDLPRYIRSGSRADLSDFYLHNNSSLKDAVRDFQVRLIKEAIDKYGSARKAAQFLKVDHSTLTRKMKKFA